jgi:hypothetical protein
VTGRSTGTTLFFGVLTLLAGVVVVGLSQPRARLSPAAAAAAARLSDALGYDVLDDR